MTKNITVQDTRAIYFSDKTYNWDDFDTDANLMKMSRSQFFVYLYKQWKEKKRFDQFTITIILLLIGFSTIIFLLIYTTFWSV